MCEYTVAIDTEISMKSVSTEFGPIQNLKSVFKIRTQTNFVFV